MIGMYDLMQAKNTYSTAKMMHNTQTAMNNEEQEINTEIKLDGHSLQSKTKRLDEIQSQTQKLTGTFTNTLNSAEGKTQKAADQDQKDQSAGGVNQGGTTDKTSGQDNTDGDQTASGTNVSGLSQAAPDGTGTDRPRKMDVRA